jgi:UDP-GlcNAc3NAcA epimerase
VDAGWNRLVSADPVRIREALASAAKPPTHPPLYGDGHAAERIIELLDEHMEILDGR